MNESTQEKQEMKTNEIQIKKKVFLFLHNDGFKESNLEPILLIDNERINIAFLKRTTNNDIYYVFQGKKYLKIWKDRKDNLLIFIDNWIGDMFIGQQQTTEYVDDFDYIAGGNELICERKDGMRKTIKLEGFDVLSLVINHFTKNEKAIFYIICTKLS
jgi:hypothetical protein